MNDRAESPHVHVFRDEMQAKIWMEPLHLASSTDGRRLSVPLDRLELSHMPAEVLRIG